MTDIATVYAERLQPFETDVSVNSPSHARLSCPSASWARDARRVSCLAVGRQSGWQVVTWRNWRKRLFMSIANVRVGSRNVVQASRV